MVLFVEQGEKERGKVKWCSNLKRTRFHYRRKEGAI
jgi:hypothetical protein